MVLRLARVSVFIRRPSSTSASFILIQTIGTFSITLLTVSPPRRSGLILLLSTSSYPYDYAAEYTFIQPELDYLTEVFDQIVLVPRVCQGKRFPLPPGVEVNEQYAEALQRAANPAKMFPLALSFPCFFHEIRRQPGILLRP